MLSFKYKFISDLINEGALSTMYHTDSIGLKTLIHVKDKQNSSGKTELDMLYKDLFQTDIDLSQMTISDLLYVFQRQRYDTQTLQGVQSVDMQFQIMSETANAEYENNKQHQRHLDIKNYQNYFHEQWYLPRYNQCALKFTQLQLQSLNSVDIINNPKYISLVDDIPIAIVLEVFSPLISKISLLIDQFKQKSDIQFITKALQYYDDLSPLKVVTKSNSQNQPDMAYGRIEYLYYFIKVFQALDELHQLFKIYSDPKKSLETKSRNAVDIEIYYYYVQNILNESTVIYMRGQQRMLSQSNAKTYGYKRNYLHQLDNIDLQQLLFLNFKQIFQNIAQLPLFEDDPKNIKLQYKTPSTNHLIQSDDQIKDESTYISQFPVISQIQQVAINNQKIDNKTNSNLLFKLIGSSSNSAMEKKMQSNQIALTRQYLNLDQSLFDITNVSNVDNKNGIQISQTLFNQATAKKLFQIPYQEAQNTLQQIKRNQFQDDRNEVQQWQYPIVYNKEADDLFFAKKQDQDQSLTSFNTERSQQKNLFSKAFSTIKNKIEEYFLSKEVKDLSKQFQDHAKYTKSDFYIKLREKKFDDVIKTIDEYIFKFTTQLSVQYPQPSLQLDYEQVMTEFQLQQEIEDYDSKFNPILKPQKSFFKDFIIESMMDQSYLTFQKYCDKIFDKKKLYRILHNVLYFADNVFGPDNYNQKQLFQTFVVRYFEYNLDSANLLLSDLKYDNTKIDQTQSDKNVDQQNSQDQTLKKILDDIEFFLEHFFKSMYVLIADSPQSFIDIYKDIINVQFLNQTIAQSTKLTKLILNLQGAYQMIASIRTFYSYQNQLDNLGQQPQTNNNVFKIQNRSLVNAWQEFMGSNELDDPYIQYNENLSELYVSNPQAIYDTELFVQGKLVDFVQTKFNFNARDFNLNFQQQAVQIIEQCVGHIKYSFGQFQLELQHILKQYVNLSNYPEKNVYKPQIEQQLQKIQESESQILENSIIQQEVIQNNMMVDYTLKQQQEKQFDTIILQKKQEIQNLEEQYRIQYQKLTQDNFNQTKSNEMQIENMTKMMNKQAQEIQNFRQILSFSRDAILQEVETNTLKFRQFQESLLLQKNNYVNKFKQSHSFIQEYRKVNKILNQQLLDKISHGLQQFFDPTPLQDSNLLIMLDKQIMDSQNLFDQQEHTFFRDALQVNSVMDTIIQILGQQLSLRKGEQIDLQNFQSQMKTLQTNLDILKQILSKITAQSNILYTLTLDEVIVQTGTSSNQNMIAIQYINQFSYISKLLELFIQKDEFFTTLIKSYNTNIAKSFTEQDIMQSEYYQKLDISAQRNQEIIKNQQEQIKKQQKRIAELEYTYSIHEAETEQEKKRRAEVLSNEKRVIETHEKTIAKLQAKYDSDIEEMRLVLNDKDSYANQLKEDIQQMTSQYTDLKKNVADLQNQIKIAQSEQQKNKITIERQSGIIQRDNDILNVNSILLNMVQAISECLFGILNKIQNNPFSNNNDNHQALQKYLQESLDAIVQENTQILSHQNMYKKSLSNIAAYNQKLFIDIQKSSESSQSISNNFVLLQNFTFFKDIQTGLDKSFSYLSDEKSSAAIENFLKHNTTLQEWVQLISQNKHNIKYCYEMTQHAILFLRYEVDQFIYNISVYNNQNWSRATTYLKNVSSSNIGISIRAMIEKEKEYENTKQQLCDLSQNFNDLRSKIGDDTYLKELSQENIILFNKIAKDIRKHILDMEGVVDLHHTTKINKMKQDFQIPEDVWQLPDFKSKVESIQRLFEEYTDRITDYITQFEDAYKKQVQNLSANVKENQLKIDQEKQKYASEIKKMSIKLGVAQNSNLSLQQSTSYNLKQLEDITQIFKQQYKDFNIQDLNTYAINVKHLLSDYNEYRQLIKNVIQENHLNLDKINVNQSSTSAWANRTLGHLFVVQNRIDTENDTIKMSLQNHIQQVQQIRQQLNEAIDNKTDLQRQIIELKSKIDLTHGTNVQNRLLTLQLADLQTGIEQLQKEKEQLIENYRKQNQNINEINEQRIKKLQEQNDKNRIEKDKVIEELEKNFEDFYQKAAQRQGSVDNTQVQQSIINSYTAQIKKLQEQLIQKQNMEIEQNIKQQIQQDAQDLHKLQVQIKQQDSKLEMYDRQVKEHLEITNQLRTEHNAQVQNIQALHNKAMDDLKTKINENQQKATTNTAKTMEDQLLYVQKLANLNLEKDNLQKLLQKEKQAFEYYKQQANTEYQQWKAEFQIQMEENKTLKQQLSQQDKRIQEYLANQTNIKNEIIGVQATTQSQVLLYQAELENLQNVNKELNSKNQNLQKDIMKFQTDNSVNNDRFKALQQTYEKVVTQLQTESNQKDVDKRKSLKTIRQQVNQLQTIQSRQKRILSDVSLSKQIKQPDIQYSSNQETQMNQGDVQATPAVIKAEAAYLSILGEQILTCNMNVDLQTKNLLGDDQIPAQVNRIDDNIIQNSSEKKNKNDAQLPQLESLLPNNSQELVQNFVQQSFILYNNLITLIQIQTFLYPHIQSYDEQALAILSISAQKPETELYLKSMLDSIQDSFNQMNIVLDFFEGVLEPNRVVKLSPLENQSRTLQKIVSSIMKIHLDSKLPLLQPLNNQKSFIKNQIDGVQHFNSNFTIFKVFMKQLTQASKNHQNQQAQQIQNTQFATQDITKLIQTQDTILNDNTVSRFTILQQTETISTSSEKITIDQFQQEDKYTATENREIIIGEISKSVDEFQQEEKKVDDQVQNTSIPIQSEEIKMSDAFQEVQENLMSNNNAKILYLPHQAIMDMAKIAAQFLIIKQQEIVQQADFKNQYFNIKFDNSADKFLPEDLHVRRMVAVGGDRRRLPQQEVNQAKFEVSIDSQNIPQDDHLLLLKEYKELETDNQLLDIQSSLDLQSQQTLKDDMVFRFKKQEEDVLQQENVSANIDKVGDKVFDLQSEELQSDYDKVKEHVDTIIPQLMQLIKAASIIQIHKVVLNNKYLKRIIAEIENFDSDQVLRRLFQNQELEYQSAEDIYSQINKLATKYGEINLFQSTNQIISDYQSMIDNLVCQLIQSEIISQNVSKVTPFKESFEFAMNFQYNSSYLGYATLDYTNYKKIGFSDNVVHYKFISDIKTQSLLQNALLIQQGKIIKEQFVADMSNPNIQQDLPIFQKQLFQQLTPAKQDEWSIMSTDGQTSTDVYLDYDEKKGVFTVQPTSEKLNEEPGLTSTKVFKQTMSSYQDIGNLNNSVIPLSLILGLGQKNIVQNPLMKNVLKIKQFSLALQGNETFKVNSLTSSKSTYVQILIGLQGDVQKISCVPTNDGKFKRIILNIPLDQWLQTYQKSPIRLKLLIQAYASYNLTRAHLDLPSFSKKLLQNASDGDIIRLFAHTVGMNVPKNQVLDVTNRFDFKNSIINGSGNNVGLNFSEFYMDCKAEIMIQSIYQTANTVDSYSVALDFMTKYINVYYYLFNIKGVGVSDEFSMGVYSQQVGNNLQKAFAFIKDFTEVSVDFAKYIAGYSSHIDSYEYLQHKNKPNFHIGRPQVYNFGNFFQDTMINNIKYLADQTKSVQINYAGTWRDFKDYDLSLFICQGSTQFWQTYLLQNSYFSFSKNNQAINYEYTQTASKYKIALPSSFALDETILYTPYAYSLITQFADNSIFNVNSEITTSINRSNPAVLFKTYVIVLWISKQCFSQLQVVNAAYQKTKDQDEILKFNNQVSQIITIYENNINQILFRMNSQCFKDSYNVKELLSGNQQFEEGEVRYFKYYFMEVELIKLMDYLVDRWEGYDRIKYDEGFVERTKKTGTVKIGEILNKLDKDKKKIKEKGGEKEYKTYLQKILAQTKANQSNRNDTFKKEIAIMKERLQALGQNLFINGSFDDQFSQYKTIQSVLDFYNTELFQSVSAGITLRPFRYFFLPETLNQITSGKNLDNIAPKSLDEIQILSESYLQKELFVKLGAISEIQVKNNNQYGIKQIVDHSWYKQHVRQSLNMNIDKSEYFISYINTF